MAYEQRPRRRGRRRHRAEPHRRRHRHDLGARSYHRRPRRQSRFRGHGRDHLGRFCRYGTDPDQRSERVWRGPPERVCGDERLAWRRSETAAARRRAHRARGIAGGCNACRHRRNASGCHRRAHSHPRGQGAGQARRRALHRRRFSADAQGPGPPPPTRSLRSTPISPPSARTASAIQASPRASPSRPRRRSPPRW